MTPDTTPFIPNGAVRDPKIANIAKPDLSADVDALRKDLETLSRDVSKLVGHVSEIGRAHAETGLKTSKEAIEKGAETAAQKAGEAKSAMEDRVRQNPLPAIGLALAAGAALSLLRKR